MNDQIKTQICRDDFYLMMRNAVLQAGGTDKVEEWKSMKFEDVVNMFAHNGLRITYMPDKNMDAVNVIWTSPAAKSNMPKSHELNDNGDVTPIKRRQLLCDQKDNGEEDETFGT